jgi:hypothetical protein
MAPIAKTDYYFLQSPKSWYSNPLHESSIIVRSSSFCNTFLELDSLGQGIGALTFDLVVVHEHFAFPVNRYVYNRKAPAPRRLPPFPVCIIHIQMQRGLEGVQEFATGLVHVSVT